MKRYDYVQNKDLYNDYYAIQSGSGIPIYSGAFSQKGHGIGSIFSGLFKNIWPLIKSVGKQVGKQALKSGIAIAGDVVEGKSFGDSAKERVPEGIKEFVKSNFGQSGSGKRRRRIKKRVSKKRKSDIFS